MKNPTPRQIAWIASALLSFLCLLSLLIINQVFLQHSLGIVLLVLPVYIFIIAYLIFYFTLEKFIYRKIKLIYKTIHHLKASKKQTEKKLDLGKDIISEVNYEVVTWAEDKKQEIEELKKMETYRREFLGNVSHELKTPIFNIQGYVYTLLEGALEDKKINKEYLIKASKNVDRLSNIVQDLEIITQIESGKLHLEIMRFDIYELVQEVFTTLELMAEANDITLNFKEGTNKTIFVNGDKERIRQVLINLINNGIKYGKESGNIWIGFYDMDKNILIEISDDGIGIEENKLSRLFERFYRVDKSRSREKGGTGLGLAIVKHIIEAHNQTINVRSKPNIGSTFGFTLTKARD